MYARLIARLAMASAVVLAGSTVSSAHESSSYTLLQANLCLSGYAGCYGKVAYPAGVEEAVARIRETRPDAVTLNEACQGDAARIARRTGYHVRFSTVEVSGRALRCRHPGGRGVFGDAVLTRAPIERSEGADFHAQSDPEWRRWLCATTRAGIDVCTAHLATRARPEAAANDAQCAELAALLERRAKARTVVFGGDINRDRPCAPEDAWERDDHAADQAPGLQSVAGTGALRSPVAAVLPAAHTDHDGLLVRARLTR